MDQLTRRKALCTLGMTATAGLLGGSAAGAQAVEAAKEPAPQATAWKYATVEPAAAAAEAYRLYPDGSCMYGLFAGVLNVLAQKQPEPFRAFPCYMMKYGAGGVGHWGSLCGALNGAAALLGLFETDKKRREGLINELFSWYEKTKLPQYKPADAAACDQSVSKSILCHVSVRHWCDAAGAESESPERKERCRRLTADVAAKTVELLNANLQAPCKFAGVGPEVKACMSCHGEQLRDTVGKMHCGLCHGQLSKNHPALPNAKVAKIAKP